MTATSHIDAIQHYWDDPRLDPDFVDQRPCRRPPDYVPKGIPGYTPRTFPATTNEAGCGDGYGNKIFLADGWHSMRDHEGILRFFDFTGDEWQDETTSAYDCRKCMDDEYIVEEEICPGGEQEPCELDYGTNENLPGGVPPGKYQELMHSVLYERALRQSRHAVIQLMRGQISTLRQEVSELREEMASKGVQCDTIATDEHYLPAALCDDVEWVDNQAQIERSVRYSEPFQWGWI